MPAVQNFGFTPLGVAISKYWDDEWIEKVVAMETQLGKKICGGRSGPEDESVCKKPAGGETNHPGEGRCKWHGGNMPIKSGKYSLLRHADISGRVEQFLDSTELMNIRNAVATSWAVIDTLLEEDSIITPDRAQEVLSGMSRISAMIKQHHDITEGQKIMIEVPQFMEWAEHLYELAIKYILLVGGDVRGFLGEAQHYYTSAVALVTGDSPPAIGFSDSESSEGVLRPGQPLAGGEESEAGSDLLRGEVHQASRSEVDEADSPVPEGHGPPSTRGDEVRPEDSEQGGSS